MNGNFIRVRVGYPGVVTPVGLAFAEKADAVCDRIDVRGSYSEFLRQLVRLHPPLHP